MSSSDSSFTSSFFSSAAGAAAAAAPPAGAAAATGAAPPPTNKFQYNKCISPSPKVILFFLESPKVIRAQCKVSQAYHESAHGNISSFH